MLIDWFTVIAQAINFLILVWLLKRFLYKPILNAINEREEKIKTQLSEAESTMEKAEKEQEKYRKKKQDIEEKREALIEEAKEDAKEKRRQQLEAARKESEELRARLKTSIREDYTNLNREIKNRLQKEVFTIARKVLKDLASASLEKHIAKTFIQRLKDWEKQQNGKDGLKERLTDATEKPLVKSAFELPSEQQENIEQEISQMADRDIDCRFETDAKKIAGIELTVGGHKIAWSINEYLESFEKQLTELLDDKKQEEEKQEEKKEEEQEEKEEQKKNTSDETTG